ncbi:Uncharacterized protein TCAP_07424 [Tolypocladium capitatum]|uniref:Uncharacterized protein n=1 Tax=Tolypocladium capitatum TaxID=45235 RepID=A0A2K3PYM3_9HYPO|nr:Uncharacterized protein TCAP_07424 [Tolypocladium capitatum]
MEQNAALRQPNFSVAAGGLRLAAEHLELCENLPSVDGGARLMQTMDAVLVQLTLLNQKVDGLDRRMEGLEHRMDGLERRMDGLVNRMDGLERKVTVSERNGATRMENSTAVRREASLAPLFSPETGTEIPGCPNTVEEAGAMSARDVDRVLRQLGASTAGNPQDRRRRLLLALGVTTQAV